MVLDAESGARRCHRPGYGRGRSTSIKSSYAPTCCGLCPAPSRCCRVFILRVGWTGDVLPPQDEPVCTDGVAAAGDEYHPATCRARCDGQADGSVRSLGRVRRPYACRGTPRRRCEQRQVRSPGCMAHVDVQSLRGRTSYHISEPTSSMKISTALQCVGRLRSLGKFHLSIFFAIDSCGSSNPVHHCAAPWARLWLLGVIVIGPGSMNNQISQFPKMPKSIYLVVKILGVFLHSNVDSMGRLETRFPCKPTPSHSLLCPESRIAASSEPTSQERYSRNSSSRHALSIATFPMAPASGPYNGNSDVSIL